MTTEYERSSDTAGEPGLLDELDAKPAPPASSWGAELRIVSELPALHPHQDEALASIPSDSTKTLLRRIKTNHRLPVLWALHAELDKRGIPPCLRPEQQIDTEQARFITTLADLLWLAKRHPGHRTLTRRVRRLMHEPDSTAWHKAALWAYQLALGQPYLLAKWLALTPEQRALTATMPTRDQATRRSALPDQLAKIHDKLLDHALDHPDKRRISISTPEDEDGPVTPNELARRRTELLRVFLLLDRDRKRTHRYMLEVSGWLKGPVNALNHQLQKIAAITGSQRLVMGPATRVRRFRDPSVIPKE